MAPTLRYEDYRIDEISQQVLLNLQSGPEEITTLVETTDAEDYGNIKHRAEAHLIPAGLVIEMNTVQRKLRLTKSGQRFIDDMDVGTISVDEIREVALDADEGVRELRDTVGDLQAEIDKIDFETIADIEQRLDEFKDAHRYTVRDEWMVDYLFNTLSDVDNEVTELRERQETLIERIDRLEERAAAIESELEAQKRHIDDVEDQAETNEVNNQALLSSLADLEDRLDDVEERQESGLLSWPGG
jgi:DNA repair exonuclease SbcCD ATPase subunit